MRQLYDREMVNQWRIATRSSITETAAHFGMSAVTVKKYWARHCTPERKAIAAQNNTTHGLSRTPEYRIWDSMRRRCGERAEPSKKKHYFDRGIRVCERWQQSFEDFYADMGPRPTPKHSIERIDVNGNYEPSNCIWATLTEQARNRRNNRMLTAFGETKTVAEWAEDPRCAVCEDTLRSRAYSGLDIVWSITAPAAQPKKGVSHKAVGDLLIEQSNYRRGRK
jgi:hypothetical protein